VLEIAMSLIGRSVLLLYMFTLVCGKHHIHMYITNNLEGKEDLNIHCKSKSDDLGLHLLHINQTYNWDFGTNFFGGTLFFCSFQWNNGRLLYLDVYDETRDYSLCSDCHWYIHKNKPCRDELVEGEPPTTLNRQCYNWK